MAKAYVEIPLTKGKVALVDVEDAERVIAAGKWSHSPNSIGGNDYAGRAKGSRMHRFILGITDPKTHVDHINGNGLDNRRENLRIATPNQNNGNATRRSDNTSGYQGVDRQGSRWRARIQDTQNGKKINVFYGVFDTREEAARAYDTAARAYWGKYASVNFPEVGERSAITGEIRTI